VSLHTLTAAAYTVLRDVNSARGGKDIIDKYVKPEFVGQMRTTLNKAASFFKHAVRDPESVLEFRPRLTEILLLDACQKYKALVGESVPELVLYVGWRMLQDADWFIFPPEVEMLRKQVRSDVLSFSGARFFAEMLPVVVRQSVISPRFP
jgi:hypothetical protein